MANVTQPISIPRSRGDAENLTAVATYFGLEPESAGMAKLTGMSQSSLGRIHRGAIQRPRPNASAHLSVLAAFVNEAAELLERVTGAPATRASMRDWLHSGWVRTSQARMRPIDALSDPQLAVEALDELRRAAE